MKLIIAAALVTLAAAPAFGGTYVTRGNVQNGIRAHVRSSTANIPSSMTRPPARPTYQNRSYTPSRPYYPSYNRSRGIR